MKTILVVDDEFDVSEALSAILQGEGYAVEVRENGRDALEYLKSAAPDLVLMDVMLPFVSGLEVLRKMRQSPTLTEVPVILMSFIAPAVNRQEFRWDAFLNKPFKLEALLGAISRCLEVNDETVERAG